VKRFLPIALLAATFAAPASAQPTQLLMPGVTYDRTVEFTLHGPVVVNVIDAPRPTGLYSLQPLLAKGAVQGREKLTSIERKLSAQTTVAAVNGGLSAATGRPEGLFLQNDVMQTQPLGSRSSLGIDPGGTLAVDRLPFLGDWRGTGPRRNLSGLNDAPGPNGTVLFTSGWAGPTPANSDAVEIVLSPFPAAQPNADLTGTVTSVLHGGNHPVAAGTAILYARGNAATRLAAEAAVGTSVTARLLLPSPFVNATSGLGGGPLLVKNGKPVFRSNESFSSSWLIPRNARTAVGQRADGSILFVVVDARPGYSSGMTNFELAQELAGLGAVTAMGLDAGPSATMAFDGALLNRPASGEKPIGNALALLYSGVVSAPVADFGSEGVNGTTLTYKLVRPSTVSAVLDGPGGAHLAIDTGSHAAGGYQFAWQGQDTQGHALPEGKWTWKVSATDDLGRQSEAERSFSYNTTLKSVTVDPSVLRRGSSVTVTADLARPAALKVTVERGNTVLRTLLKRQVVAGKTTIAWNGRLPGKLLAPVGSYVVRVTATNQIGAAELTAAVKRARR